LYLVELYFVACILFVVVSVVILFV
jgi:hypothetical protein